MSNKSTMLLEHHLKELKLPTFLREYDKLATQCQGRRENVPAGRSKTVPLNATL